MGERKGVNKYYPPDYDPTKGGLNAYHGTHALRERAKKIDQGILIIRFEMPYNIWCNGCGNHIGMGVRYNAEKRRVGAYYSTPIYKFRMKCALCEQYFEIRTDPKNCEYEILSGCRRKEQRWDTEAAGNVQTTHREVKEKMMTNAMFNLEHSAEDKVKVGKLAPNLTRLEEIRGRWDDDFAINQKLRKNFRTEKKKIQARQDADETFKSEKNLPDDLILQEEHQDDVIKSKRMRYGEDTRPDLLRRRKRSSIKQSSIFGSTDTNAKNNKDGELSKSIVVKPSSSSKLMESHKDSKGTVKTSSSKTILLGIVRPTSKPSSGKHKKAVLGVVETDESTSTDCGKDESIVDESFTKKEEEERAVDFTTTGPGGVKAALSSACNKKDLCEETNPSSSSIGCLVAYDGSAPSSSNEEEGDEGID